MRRSRFSLGARRRREEGKISKSEVRGLKFPHTGSVDGDGSLCPHTCRSLHPSGTAQLGDGVDAPRRLQIVSFRTAISVTYMEERASGVPVVSRSDDPGQCGPAGLRAPGRLPARRRNQRKRSHRYGPRPSCTRNACLTILKPRQPTVRSSPTGYSPSRACKIDHRSGLASAGVIPFLYFRQSISVMLAGH
jgi:hypothetical protein